ncbi:MAG: NAD(P)-binding domain-containing protein [Myxococcales bacterium]|nr:NAD(P)-binding domain-containing protein [Myxococcales bacterium]
MSPRGDTVGIIGAGRFGTALGSVLARGGRRVVLYSRDTAVVSSIQGQRKNPRVPAAALPAPLEATADPKRLAAEARFLVLAVASTDVRDRARELGDVLDGSHIVVHAIGALAAPTNERVSEVMAQGLPTLKLGVLAGPALPPDLIEGQFASMVIASTFDEVVAEGRRLLNAPPGLRVYSSKDLVGVELASALAGAYTVALGLADGLGMGAGPRAVLITRAVAEASRLGAAAGAEGKTFAGLAGLGNLLVRSSSDRSLDYQLGKRLADGIVTADNARTEGARAAIAGVELARSLRTRMPVLQGLAAILSGKLEPKDAARLIGDTVAVEE